MKNYTANNLKSLRLKSKLSQADLAKLLGISRSAVSSYENGTRQPNHEMLIKYATLYGVTTDFLLGRSDSVTSSIEDDFFIELRCLLNTSNLSSDKKAEILAEVKGFFQWKLNNSQK